MNLKFESLIDSLDENLARTIGRGDDEKELEAALESAEAAMKNAIGDNKNIVAYLPRESEKEIIIKNANDEKIAVIRVDEVKTNSTTRSNDKTEIVLAPNKLQNELLENNTMKEMGIDPIKGASKFQNFIEKAETLGFVGKILASAGKIGATLVDSIAKKFFKDKFKINYATYNNGKKALSAAIKKDAQTFAKKAMDVVLGMFKKVPSTTKMVFRNVKNKVIEEVFSLGKFLIAK